ncbi:class I SAM-dependent methyltransferase [Monashia sp. NPDC004114]
MGDEATEQAASSTAVLVCQGRAAAYGRYALGRFHDSVARELLDPSELAVVDDVREGRVPPSGPQRMSHEMVQWVGVSMVPRTIAIDEAVAQHGALQVVILGAGLDSRAWRMTELAAATVFEVDHPASSRDKLRRLAGRPAVAATVVPVAVDLSRDALAPALEHASFDRSVRTTWVWEGVVPYLRAEAVRSTVNQVAHLSAPGSRLVVNYQAKSLRTSAMRRVMRLLLRVTRQEDPMAREPWRSLWRPDGIRKLLSDNGFDVESDLDLLELSAGLDLPAGNPGSLRNGRVAIATHR